MKIGIITAMPEETRAIITAIGGTKTTSTGGAVRYRANQAGHEIVIAEGGMGPANATEAAMRLVAETHPDLLISAGFCGGIRDGLRVGDGVLAERLVVVSADGIEEVPVNVHDAARRFAEVHTTGECRLVNGLFATTRVIMAKGQLAGMLPPEARFPVVEMESGAIALVAAAHGIPFIGLRTVSDPHDEELGFSLDEFCDDRMRIRIPRVLLTIARKPRIIPQLIRLAGNSRVAADSLARAIRQLMAVM